MEDKKSIKRRTLRILCIVLTIAGAAVLLYQLVIFIWMSIVINGLTASGTAGSIGVIGGADGPTAVFVTRTEGGNWALPVALLALVLGSAGLFRMRKK